MHTHEEAADDAPKRRCAMRSREEVRLYNLLENMLYVMYVDYIVSCGHFVCTRVPYICRPREFSASVLCKDACIYSYERTCITRNAISM